MAGVVLRRRNSASRPRGPIRGRSFPALRCEGSAPLLLLGCPSSSGASSWCRAISSSTRWARVWFKVPTVASRASCRNVTAAPTYSLRTQMRKHRGPNAWADTTHLAQVQSARRHPSIDAARQTPSDCGCRRSPPAPPSLRGRNCDGACFRHRRGPQRQPASCVATARARSQSRQAQVRRSPHSEHRAP